MSDFEYDYQRFDQIIKLLLESAWIRHDEELEIGEDDLEDEDENDEYRYTEGGNRNMQSFAIFIHNDALTEGFVFPPHNTYSFTFGRVIQHRPDEEVCIFAWYDVESDDWDIIPLEDRLSEDNSMDAEDVMRILEGLHQKYFV